MADRHQRDRELEALRERLSRLSEASAHINGSLDFDTVLQGVLDSARSLTAARYGVMTLFGEGGGIEDFLASGIAPEEAEALWLTPDSLEILEALTETSSPLRVPDLMEHVRSLGFTTFTYPMPAPGVFRFLIAPMLYRGEQVGHFFIGDKDDGAEFTRADEETLVMFASQAAPVIANARLHRDEQRARAGLETLVNTSPVGVVVIDAQSGALVSFNREATRVVEGLREVDQPLEELLAVVTCVRADGREMSPTMLPLPKLLSAGETIRSEEIVLRVPDGRSVAALLNATPIHSDDGAVASFVVTLQDMTPLQGQERLQAEFLAMVSHELRTPLAAVTGAVATLLDTAGGLDPGETKQFLRIIREQSDQMRHLIGDLLDVARINTGTLPVAPEPADVQMLVDDAKTRFLTADVSPPPTSSSHRTCPLYWPTGAASCRC